MAFYMTRLDKLAGALLHLQDFKEAAGFCIPLLLKDLPHVLQLSGQVGCPSLVASQHDCDDLVGGLQTGQTLSSISSHTCHPKAPAPL